MSGQRRKIKVADLNPHLICVLCGGYYVDATTIIECLHSFCKACIVRYLESNKYCPICDVQVHKTKPLQNIRADHTLQSMVNKLVPGLFQNEMLRRREFYLQNPEARPLTKDDAGQVDEHTKFYTPDESFSLSLEYLNSEENYSEECSSRRFLRCPAAVTVSHLQKLIRAKYGLATKHRVDIIHVGDILEDHLTLMDIAYIYRWRRKGPLRLNYCILESRAKRIKLEHNADKKDPDHIDCTNSSKPFEFDIVDNIHIVLDSQPQDKTEGKPVKTLDRDENKPHDENKNKWKEVQIQISENGVMSVTDISLEQNNNNNNSNPTSNDMNVSVLKNVQSHNLENAYSSVLSSNVVEKRHLQVDYSGAPLEEGIVSTPLQLPENSGEKSTTSKTTLPSNNLLEMPVETKGPESLVSICIQNEVSSSPLASFNSGKQSKHEDSSCNSPKSEKSNAKSKNRDPLEFSDKHTFSAVECGPVNSVCAETKVCMKRSVPSAEEPKPSVTTLNSKSNFSNVKKQSPGISNPVGYKTLKTPPKSWNPSITHSNLLTCKSDSLPSNTEVNMLSGKGVSGTGKVGINVSSGNISSKYLTESSASKQTRIFKTRIVPRYLGNPASRVKPMFQAVTNPNTSCKVENGASVTSHSKPTLTVTKIDPKTLCPIPVVSSVSTHSTPNNFVPNNCSSTIASVSSIPYSHSATSGTKTEMYSQLPSSLTLPLKGPNSMNSFVTQPSNNVLQTKLAPSSGLAVPRTSCQPFTSASMAPAIAKNAPHLLYVFSGNTNRLPTPFHRAGFGTNANIGAFHPLPPSVNMLFNPHLQHHRLQSQCVSTSSQTLTTPSIQRVPATSLHHKFGTANVNNNSNNKGIIGNCANKTKGESNSKESLQNVSSGISYGTAFSSNSNEPNNRITANNDKNMDVMKNSGIVSAPNLTTLHGTTKNVQSNEPSVPVNGSVTITDGFATVTPISGSLNLNLPTTASSLTTISIASSAPSDSIKNSDSFNGRVSMTTCNAISAPVSVKKSSIIQSSSPITCPGSTKVVASKVRIPTPSLSCTSTTSSGVMADISSSVSDSSLASLSKAPSVMSSASTSLLSNFISSSPVVHNVSPALTFTTHCNTALKTASLSPFISVPSTLPIVSSPISLGNVSMTFPLIYKSACATMPADHHSVTNWSGKNITPIISSAAFIPGSLGVPPYSATLKVINTMTGSVPAAGSSTLFASTCKESTNSINTSVSSSIGATLIPSIAASVKNSDNVSIPTSSQITSSKASNVDMSAIPLITDVTVKRDVISTVSSGPTKMPLSEINPCVHNIAFSTHVPSTNSAGSDFSTSGSIPGSNVVMSTVTSVTSERVSSGLNLSSGNSHVTSPAPQNVDTFDTTTNSKKVTVSTAPSSSSTLTLNSVTTQNISCSLASVRNSNSTFSECEPCSCVDVFSDTKNSSSQSPGCGANNKKSEGSDTVLENSVSISSPSIADSNMPVQKNIDPLLNQELICGSGNNDEGINIMLKHNCIEKISSLEIQKSDRLNNEEKKVNNNVVSCEKKSKCEKVKSEITVLNCDDVSNIKRNEDCEVVAEEPSSCKVYGSSDCKSQQSLKSQESVLCKDAASGMQCNNNCAKGVSSSCEIVGQDSERHEKQLDVQEKCVDKLPAETLTKDGSGMGKSTSESGTEVTISVKNMNNNEQKCSNVFTKESHNV